MKLSQFKVNIPESLFAQYPLPYRDDSRMLVLHRKTGDIEHKSIKDIVSFFDDGDVFVFNDAKVFPARLYAQKEKTMANIEIFLLRELNHELRYWDVLVDPARKIRIGNKLFLDEDLTIVAEVIDNTTSRGRTVRFLTDYDNSEFLDRLYELGHTPLPKYIHRPLDEERMKDYEALFPDYPIDEMDMERYQTIFADKIGAVAVPASGLHFSKQLLKRMEIAGIDSQFLTSYVSLGNFKTIEVDDLPKHKMDSEEMVIEQPLVDAVDRAHAQEKHICAVGTEVIRALEQVAGTVGQIKTYNGWTSKFIYPPYDFAVADSCLVNLYASQSIQLLCVAAFGGYEAVMDAYEVAVSKGYRFGDYGDAMLIVD